MVLSTHNYLEDIDEGNTEPTTLTRVPSSNFALMKYKGHAYQTEEMEYNGVGSSFGVALNLLNRNDCQTEHQAPLKEDSSIKR